MEDGNPQRREIVLQYPAHWLNPRDLLGFIHSRQFDSAWKQLELTDDDLSQLQVAIIAHPKGHPVIPGTGALRKIRFSPDGSPKGKSGSHRACYVYFEEFGIIYLVTAYPKGRKDDLSPDERKAIKRLIAEVRQLLEERGPIK